MSLLFFGGSFNPIHHGHLVCSRAVAERGGYSGVCLIPSAQPPHKQSAATLAPVEDRLAMCQLAIQSSGFFSIDPQEVARGGISYTIDTATALRRQTGETVHWLIGADMLTQLLTWHRAADLLRDVRFVVMARPGWELNFNDLPPELRRLRENVVEAPLIDISATDIRRRAASGLTIDYLTPPAVCRYISERGLYRHDGPPY